MKRPSPRRLTVEPLEDRLTPTTGIPWFDPGSLTLSFVPDGTATGNGTTSNLTSLLGPGLQSVWQREILRAFQTWAVHANINIGLAGDSGLAMGTAGLPQEDPRFGDIRIAARPLTTGTNTTLAQGIGFDYGGGTWSGDVVLNSNVGFGFGGNGGEYDLFTIALHEAGHSFGLADRPDDPTSAMWGHYTTGLALSAADVAILQSLYGARSADPYEGAGGNDTLATAFDLTSNGNLTAISADVTHTADADHYRFTTPPSTTGIHGLTVNLQVAGISLLTARVTVLDAAGNVVASGVAIDPTANNVSVTLPNYQPSATYFVKVEGVGGDVFAAGAYNLRLSYGPQGHGNSAVTGSQYVNVESVANNSTLSLASTLGMVSARHSTTFAAVGSINQPADVDWYRITPSAAAGFGGTLSVGVVPLDGSGFRPTVAVYDAQGNQIPAVVVTNESGAFTVQLAGQQTGTTYYLRVSAANPAGNHAVGAYTLAANLSRAEGATFNAAANSTLNATQTTTYSTLSVTEDRLVQFSLAATSTGGARSAVRMSILDGTGAVVYTMVSVAGEPLTTGTIWLLQGEYTVVFHAATQDGSPLRDLTFNLGMRVWSDPIDPYPEDPGSPPPPTSPPPPAEPIIVSPAAPEPPPTPTIGTVAVVNPFLGLF